MASIDSIPVYYIATFLALSSLVHAKGGGRGGGGGGGGGGSSSSSGSSAPCTDCVAIGPWQVQKKWVIIVSVVLGIVILIIVLALLKKFGCFTWLTRRARVKQEAKRRKEEEAEILRQEEWGRRFPQGQQQQHYAPIGGASQQSLPYAQGGLGYAHGTGHVIYLPPVDNHVPYSIPYTPPQHQHRDSQSQISVPSSPPSHYRYDSQAHLNPYGR